ncbi:MAG: adenylate/guanylate cyclase domain-containing protein [Desulfobacterales bacterium]|nr:adenylate/guanylate cyclase domain-containing protein [Desulfobacterales bacterium]
MNKNILQNKLDTLKAFQYLNPNTIDKIGDILYESDDWDLLRINPLRFTKQHEIEENACIDIFIHGVKIGLFDFSYNMLCPLCGGVVQMHHELDELEQEKFYCSVCNEFVPTILDGQVEVAFTIHPDIKKLQTDPLQDRESYYRYYFSANYEKSEELTECAYSGIIDCFGFEVLKSDEIFTVSVTGNPHHVYQFVSIGYNTSCWIHFDKNEAVEDKNIEINLLPSGFTPSEIHVSDGEYQVKIHNRTKNKFGFLVHRVQREKMLEIVKKYPLREHPFFTASRLINNQSFRDLFRVQKLSESLNLNVKNLTIMFTDLKGSTAMYDEAGDMFAYKLIKEHFKLLSESVRNHSGAIVKTMGDAVMATFVSPLNGLLCALDMIQKIDRLNKEWDQHGYRIGLKVGLNNGPALTVVNDERLDYFGQSINVAARIQGLAGADEIYLSDSVYKDAGAEQLISSHGYVSECEEALLKGVGQPMAVYKIYRQGTDIVP